MNKKLNPKLDRRLTRSRATARALMYLEAADHMEMDVTDVPMELDEAKKLARKLHREADKWFTFAANTED